MNNDFKINKALDILSEVINTISTRTRYDDIEIDDEQSISYSILENGNKDIMRIGTKFIYDTNHDGFVDNKTFAYLLALPFHEERHTLQRYEMMDKTLRKSNPKLQRMLLDTKLSNYFPEYYTASYWDNIAEMDAERYALHEASKFFTKNRKLLKQLPFDEYLTDCINDRRMMSTWYAHRPIKSLEDGERILEQKINEKLNDNTPYKNIASTDNKYEIPVTYPLMQDMSETERQKLEKASTLHKQQAIMIAKIYAYNDKVFRECADIMPGITKIFTYLNESVSDPQVPRNRTIPKSEYPSFMQDGHEQADGEQADGDHEDTLPNP